MPTYLNLSIRIGAATNHYQILIPDPVPPFFSIAPSCNHSLDASLGTRRNPKHTLLVF